MTLVVIVVVGLVLLGAISGAVTQMGERKDSGKEWRRTCRRCSTVWYVSPQAAREKAPDRAEMASAKMYRASRRMSLYSSRASAAELRVQNLEDRAARVRSVNACPSCGSAAFDQALVDA